VFIVAFVLARDRYWCNDWDRLTRATVGLFGNGE
jgi:hypothetical protein